MSTFLCSKCGSYNSDTIDSRPRNGYVRRRRECLDCKQRITTYETTRKPQDYALEEVVRDAEVLDKIKVLLRICESP